jgi:hypothetical protein
MNFESANPIVQRPRLLDPALTLSLDGAWKVARWPFTAEETRLAGPAVKDARWETVEQPGRVFYSNPEEEANPPANWNRITLSHVDPEDGAVLRKTVRIPSAWKGKRIFLRLDAVYPAGRFYLDGRLLGEHLSGLTPVEFDVTGLARPGRDAVFAVRLIRRHRFVQMDMVRHALEFCGLAQSACLFALEPCHLAGYHLVSGLSPSLNRGALRGSVTVANAGPRARAAAVRVRVTDASGACVAKAEARGNAPARGSVALPVSLTIARPKPWSDEFPNLYTVTLDLRVAGQPVRSTAYRTGFRRLDLRPEGPRLNGSFIKFRGVNHLTFHPEHGMFTPEPWLRKSLALMKRANVNAIRTHFLGPRCLADLCDEMGLYLLQELPVDWGTDYIHDPEWMPPARLRIEGGVLRDRHHPSVMVWSIGNENMPKTRAVSEAGWRHLRELEALVKRLDPSRATMFPPPGPANAIEGILELRVGDIADIHYSFNPIRRFLKEGAVENPNSWEADMVRHTREEVLRRGGSCVWFSSEYGIFNAMPDLLHSPFCSIIDDVPEEPLSGKSTMTAFEERLDREWGLMRSEPSCLGGAYFPWLCCGAGSAAVGNPWGWVRWGEDADWGVVTADLLPKPFFWALRVLFSPVRFPARVTWTPGETEIRFPVQNQFHAFDLKDCTLRVQQNPGGAYMTMMRAFRDIPMRGAPGETAEIRIPLGPEILKALNEGRFGLCRCTLLDPRGFRPVTADILVLPPEAHKAADALPMPIGPDAIL